ncbi:hypothetical protein [Streptomyces sp. MZ04]|uniref:hypothetical protein n=1 Tax=Streptomyces sp. MZ04 TaxID=2559236 RepID=UPI00107EE898|nr:hypothetical protein [Streptomyces sp. MZ04]TGA96430.1 hypothetical protein E2651_32505 [Streptomyces sp. MZ04]
MRKGKLRLAAVVVTAVAGFLATANSQATAAPSGHRAAAVESVPPRPAGVYGPYAIYESCWVAGNNGQQAGQWQSFFCSQNGTDQWWLFTTP